MGRSSNGTPELVQEKCKNGTRRVLVFLADTHGGHRLGLLNPKVELIEEAEDGELVTRQG